MEKNEEACRQSRILEALIEASESAILVVDENGKILAYNQRFLQLWGIPAEVMDKGLDAGALAVGTQQLVEPEAFIQKVQWLYEHKDVVSRDELLFKDGRVVSRFSPPVRGADGEYLGRAWFFRDITEKREADQRRQEREGLLTAVFDQSYNLMGLLSLNGTLLRVNATALGMIGKKESEVLGRPFWDTPWWSHSTELQVQLREAIRKAAEGFFVRFLATHPGPDGQLASIDFTLKPVRDRDGKVVWVIPEGRDITERVWMEERLRRYNRMLQMVNQANRALVDAEEPTGLLRRITAIIVENGGYAISWAGITAPLARELPLVTAAVGLDGGSPSSWLFAGEEGGQELDPVQEGLRSGLLRLDRCPKTVDEDRELVPRALLTLPLIPGEGEGRPIGVLCIGSEGPDSFSDREEWELLSGMAHDLAFGIALIRGREERRRAEQALLASETRYRGLFENANDGIVILSDGIFIDCNQKAIELFGAPREKLLGRSPGDFSPPFQPGGGLSSECARERIEKAFAGEPQRFEWRHFRLDGTPIDTEITLSRLDLKDKPMVLGIMRDVTERKAAVDALRVSEHRYRSLYDGMNEAFAMTDLSGNLAEANEAFRQLTGYTAAELKKMTFNSLTPERWHEMEARIIKEQVLVQGYSDIYEKEYCRKDGRIVPIELKVHLLRDEDQRPTHLWAIIRDISERRKAEEERSKLQDQLRQAQKMESIGRLAGGVAHDFNNLLTAISGNLELALLELAAPEGAVADHLRESARAAESAASLTRQLLAFSRRQIIEPKLLDLNSLIQHIQKMLIRLIGEDIQLETVLKTPLGRIHADPGQIEQIILNLVVNARDAMPDGGLLTMETAEVHLGPDYVASHPGTAPGSFVKLSISDTGIGFSQEAKAHLFEPFFTTKPQGKGTGLGLAMVYGVVKQHGGSIQVYSEPGVGTTFKMYFPVAAEGAEAEKWTAEAVPETMPTGTEKILLVEDEPLVRDFAVGTLQRLGYQVFAFGSGEAALDALNRELGPLDILISDVVLPGMNGRALAEAVTDRRPGLRVLFMSGYTEEIIVHHGVLNPGLQFIGKPFSAQALAVKVRKVLDAEPERAD